MDGTDAQAEPQRLRWWGISFAPVSYPVLCDGRQVPCDFLILDDAAEERLTRYMATLPLEIPDMPEPQKGLEAFWQHDLALRMQNMRARAEARALIALSLVAINGEPFTLSFEEKVEEIKGWPPRLITGLVDAIGDVSRAPIVGLEALRAQPDFAMTPSLPGAFFGGVMAPNLPRA